MIDRYPAEWRDRIRADFQELLSRERHYLLSQVQYLLTQYHCCATLQGLRADVDDLFLNSDDVTLPALRSAQAEASAGRR